MAICDLFDRGATFDRVRPFAVDASRTIPFSEAAELSHRIANGLTRAKIGPGCAAAVYSPNSAIGFVCVIGIMRSGAAWIPLNFRDGLQAKIAFLQHTEAACLFYDPAVEGDVAGIANAVPTLRLLVALGPSEVNLQLPKWAADQRPVFESAPFPAAQIAALDGTGGTTGRPKAAMQSHRALETMAANVLTAMPMRTDPVVSLIATPMSHGAGNLAHALMGAGATNVLLPKFDPEEVLWTIERFRVTHMFLPPTAIYTLLAHEGIRRADVSSLRYLVYGGAPIATQKLKEAIDVFGPVLTQVYGQAEACLACTCLTPADHQVQEGGDETLLASCGRPALLTPVRVMDDEGQLLQPGERGEVVVQGGLVMSGYFHNQAATAAATTNGWHRTGDIGYVDERGFVYIVDRKSDMIISGGFNVYPAEVERALLDHPSVRECAVIGLPDEKWGEAVAAVVELVPGARVTEVQLIGHCKTTLGSIKAPKRVEVWEHLPRSANGKVLRREVRRDLAKQCGLA
jgi:acyl-CoA synthetase (AMP-forming)/AMP-acid ligase II